MNLNMMAAALLAASALAGCAAQAPPPAAPPQVFGAKHMDEMDADFATYMEQVATFDAEGAKLAASNKAGKAVLDYARDVAANADALQPRLRHEMDAGGVAPARLGPEFAARLARLAALTGPAFDRQYLQDELHNRDGAQIVLQREARESKDAEMRAMADEQLLIARNEVDRGRALAGR